MQEQPFIHPAQFQPPGPRHHHECPRNNRNFHHRAIRWGFMQIEAGKMRMAGKQFPQPRNFHNGSPRRQHLTAAAALFGAVQIKQLSTGNPRRWVPAQGRNGLGKGPIGHDQVGIDQSQIVAMRLRRRQIASGTKAKIATGTQHPHMRSAGRQIVQHGLIGGRIAVIDDNQLGHLRLGQNGAQPRCQNGAGPIADHHHRQISGDAARDTTIRVYITFHT